MSRDRVCAKQWFMHNGSYVDTNMSIEQRVCTRVDYIQVSGLT